jgi:hypothetical protein
MRLAELQLAAVQQNGWTPELTRELERVNREASSPVPQALSQFLLKHPVRAKTLNETMPLPENLSFELQHWALHRFWPLPPTWVTAASETNPYWRTWETRDRQKAEALVSEARPQVISQQSAAAEQTLVQAQKYYLLLPEIYFLMAKARFQIQDPVGAEAHLQTALLLGYTPTNLKEMARFQKQVLQAKKRFETRPKRTF